MEIIKKNARNFVSAVRAKVDGLLDVRVIALVMCARFENLLNVVCVTGAWFWSHGTDGSTEGCSGDAEEVDFRKPFGHVFSLPEA